MLILIQLFIYDYQTQTLVPPDVCPVVKGQFLNKIYIYIYIKLFGFPIQMNTQNVGINVSTVLLNVEYFITFYFQFELQRNIHIFRVQITFQVFVLTFNHIVNFSFLRLSAIIDNKRIILSKSCGTIVTKLHQVCPTIKSLIISHCSTIVTSAARLNCDRFWSTLILLC